MPLAARPGLREGFVNELGVEAMGQWLAGFKWGVGVALAIMASGCVREPLLPPSKGGDPWLEYRSAHFTLISDADDDDALRVISNLERTYALLAAATFHGRAAPSFQTHAIVFRDYHDLRQFAGDDVGGYYAGTLPNELEPTPTVVATTGFSPRILFGHELAHRFNHLALGVTPVWMNEGLAEYYSTIRGEPSAPVLGDTDPEVFASGGIRQSVGDIIHGFEILRARSLPKASALIRFDAQQFYRYADDSSQVLSWEVKQARKVNYATAGMLVHFLMHGAASYAKVFQTLLAEPEAGGGKGLKLARVVEGVRSELLDADFEAYLKTTIPWRQYHPPQPAKPDPLSTRPLAESEVLTWWARLDAFNGPSSERAERHLQAALKASPNDAQIWFWLGRANALNVHVEEAERHFARAMELEPDTPEFNYGLLDLYWNSRTRQHFSREVREQKVGELVEIMARSARTPRHFNALAMHAIMKGDGQAAVTFATKACDLGPDCWECLHNYALARYQLGEHTAALALEREALARLPEQAGAQFWTLIRDSLAFYQHLLDHPEDEEARPPPLILP